MKAVLLVAVVLAAGCASSHHQLGATTPRSVQVEGTAWDASDKQKAFDMAEAACQKHERHANFIEVKGSKARALYTFDCAL
jgi:hypothetical protein